MACPCDAVPVLLTISNPPGRSTIAYRVGDYLTFRYALLQALPDEVELVAWRPSAQGDLALQMMEWWAYLADILTFYNERIANQDYLRTADLPESVQRLVRVLGYRPRPGIGAQGTLAALLSGRKPITLPLGFQIQSKPGPGKQPQIFELTAPTLIHQPDAVTAVPAAPPELVSEDGSVVLAGSISSIKAGDQVLLLKKGWTGTDQAYAAVEVQNLSIGQDPTGDAITRVTFTQPPALPGAAAADYRLLRSSQSAHLWPYPANPAFVITAGQVDLESITRGIKVGDPVLFATAGSSQAAIVKSYLELVWYANPDDPPLNPTLRPASLPIPIPHSEIQYAAPAAPGITMNTLVRYAWQDVGTLIPSPATTLGAATSLVSVPPALFPALNGEQLLIEDANGLGDAVTAASTPGRTAVTLSGLATSDASLSAPFNVLLNQLSVTCGKTVQNESLGSGDATVAGQDFVLQNSPVTYLPSAASTSGDGYSSTVQVWINGIQWREVPSFYGQNPSAHIFVTSEDEQNQTHVTFGDGVYGARLPTGANVLATYRCGSGADAPDAGSLTVILQPQPGLKSIRNPVAVSGGADPDPAAKIKKYAPQSVLTFGRAVSADDYETLAAQAPGVVRAKSYWTWDALQQRSLVKIYVGDDAGAVTSARAALAAAEDPNRPVQVSQATPVNLFLNLSLVIDPDYVASDVIDAASSALLDPNTGLFGKNVIGIGQSIYESQIFQSFLGVPGTIAVHDLQVLTLPHVIPLPGRFDPGEGSFFQLTAAQLAIAPEVAP